MITKNKKQQVEAYHNDWQDDRFYFIAGYTSGGAPYGTTWEEMELEPTEMKKLSEQSIVLKSERLILRKITPDDFDDLAVMLRDSDVMTAWEHTFSDEQIRQWIDNQTARYQKEIVGYFAAIRKDTGEFIGQMGLLWNDFDELRVMEIGYMLKRQYWGMGYATEGAAALAQYAFTEIGLNKIYASIRPENQSSIRVAERIGMNVEGSFIKQYNGKDMEHLIYSKERCKDIPPIL
jgi:RimJ/RimL family protein N-acetyltransferase